MASRDQISPEERITRAADLKTLGRDLVSLALNKKWEPIYKRMDLIKRVENTLRIGENPLLVGKPGVGKNAIVEGLVSEMASRMKNELDVTKGECLSGVRAIYECQPMAFQVDCFYCHEFESKLQKIVENCRSEGAILFIDNIHLAIEAGGTLDAPGRTLANLLKPYLEKKELTVIGATTLEGYDFMLSRNPTFVNLFTKIDIPETSLEETKEILYNLKPFLENLYKINIGDDFINQIVEITNRFFPQRAFPGKALEVLREVIAQAKAKEQTSLTASEVYSYISTRTGLAEFIALPEKKINRDEVIKFFQERIFDQDLVIEAIGDTILKFKAGLNDPERPVDVILLMGPTGVGKTELAKVLAEYIFGSQKKLIRFDMSEYKGYIGYEKLIGSRLRSEPGLIISAALANPFAVYLFDEIEKAEGEIFDVFLQVFGEGRITDPKGQTVDLTNSIIIMTSNIGSELYKKMPFGFTPDITKQVEDIQKKIDELLRENFRPEFINRINKILYFKPLSKLGVKKIAQKELNRLETRYGLKEKCWNLIVEDEVIELLIENGYNPEYGARPMQRAVERFVVTPLAAKLASENVPPNVQLIVKLNEKKEVEIEVKK
ncbi:MAG: AAA family ATPase [Candidatus Omnitrophica bacterium]|nr:AAA family ATPase [Candidatus Omnitrophota bacterium]